VTREAVVMLGALFDVSSVKSPYLSTAEASDFSGKAGGEVCLRSGR
jgi:hypothetical protein